MRAFLAFRLPPLKQDAGHGVGREVATPWAGFMVMGDEPVAIVVLTMHIFF